MNFLQKLYKEKGPLMVLAPMADVTDVAFREMFAECGQPDVFWTEFVASDGLVRAPKDEIGKDGLTPAARLRKDLLFTEKQRPIMAQLFSGNPEYMEIACEEVARLGFDGIDLNMGCPDSSIEKQGAGSGCIKNPENAQQVILAAKRGVARANPNNPIPVTVKTRLGYNTDELETWLPMLLETEPAAITFHARTRKEMSKVPARWERVGRAVEIRDAYEREKYGELEVPNTLIFGNGDVTSLEDGDQKIAQAKCEGVMVGRAIFGNPWFFNREVDRDRDVSIEERLRVMVKHTKLFEKELGFKNFAVMKKHYKAYCEGFDGAKELRVNLFDNAQNPDEVEKIVEKWIDENVKRSWWKKIFKMRK